jgi:hypothetical protein
MKNIENNLYTFSVSIIYEMIETGKVLHALDQASAEVKKELKSLCQEAHEILRIEEEGSPYHSLRVYLDDIANTF